MPLESSKESIPPELRIDFPSLEGMSDDEALGILTRSLERISGDKDAPTIVALDGINTIGELIDHLQRKTPEGLRFLRIYRDLSVVMAGLNGKKDRPVRILERCKRTFAALWNHK